MNELKYFLCVLFTTFLALNAHADDEIELRTTTIKGNTELPKILYVVPWQDAQDAKKSQQKLVLHSLFGDLFDPVTPPAPNSKRARKN